MNGRDAFTPDWFGRWTRQARRRFARRLSATAARAGRSLASEQLESRAMLAVSPPAISIEDAMITERDSGTQSAAVVFRLSRAVGVNVTVRYATANGTALAGSDYVARSGTLTFPAGTTTRVLPIAIRGDRVHEPTERFSVNLSTPRRATIADRTATITITDNDPAPLPPAPTPTPTPIPGDGVVGRVFAVNPAGDDIVGFDPARDRLDFGPVSVHNLILGKLATGEVAIVNPWATTPEYQVVRGITYRDLTMANFGIVRNEHLRQDVGGVVSWEQGIGPRAAGTVYLRSHEYGLQERVVGFDPVTTRLSFLYFGTRERLSLTDTAEGLVISVQPTNQGVLLVGVSKSQLVPANVEFHHDQIVEDQLEVPFAHPAEHFTLASRMALLTPAAPVGEVTDGHQTSIGAMPPGGHDHGTAPMPNPMPTPAPTPAPAPTGSVSFAVTSDWGSGFNGDVTVRNTGTAPLSGWTVSFDFEGTISTLWNGVIAERAGTRYTVRNEHWNGTLAAGAATSFGFTATPGGAAAVLRNLLLVGAAATPAPSPTPAPTPDPAPTPTPPPAPLTPPAVAVGYFATRGNQIVDATGASVRLAGVNWFGFETSTFAPHGLWARGYREMMDQMRSLGFNTIRLPYSDQLFEAGSVPNGINLAKNSDLTGLTGLQIMDRIVAYAGTIGLRVVLDHHRSEAGNSANSSGLWYTAAYPEAVWIANLRMLARRYAGQPAVVGIDLHNEPHGPATWGDGGPNDWRLAAERAGNAVLAENPNLLVIVEGIERASSGNYWWGGNLSNAGAHPVRLAVANRLVYSAHDYPASVYRQAYFDATDYPANLPDVWDRNWGYLFRTGTAPVLLGEFGSKLETASDRAWFNAMVQYLKGDFDGNGSIDLAAGDQGVSWTYWSWNPNSGDTGGILADDWTTVNAAKVDPLRTVQFVLPGSPTVTPAPTPTPVPTPTPTPVPQPADPSALPIASHEKVLAAYFPEWGIYGRNYQVADVPAERLTHLIYSFLDLKSNGEVALFDSFAAVEKRFPANETVSGEADLWYYPPGDPRATQTVWGNFNQLAQLKAKYPHLKVSIAVGGWTLSTNFSTVCATESGRETFANSLVRFLDTYRMFDGIDFDWEYPGGGGLGGNSVSPNDGANYALLMQKVRAKVDALGARLGREYELSIASPAGIDKIVNFNLPGLAPSVDFFNLMTYDFHGTWESTTGHLAGFTADPAGYDVKTAVTAYLAAGVPAAKIVLGAPLYTRAWSGVANGGDGGYAEAARGAAPGSFEAGNYDYKDLLAKLQDPASGWKLYWDDTAQAAYLYNGREGIFSSFETPTSIAQKSQWAASIGLGGMMFWDISNDATASAESLVLAAYNSWVLDQDMAEIRARSALTSEIILGGDGVIGALPAAL